MTIPSDYAERVYAGVLGKMIGVYLGRPFEGMLYRDVLKNLGEINYYVHERRNVALVVADDDLSGTFTFARALADHPEAGAELSAAQVGATWLNYIVEGKAILWWGGMGLSTEQTAFARLKAGVPAPQSGSMRLNGKVVAEQIGSQIFIDGWAMVAPGRPDLAADLARKAASVSHDGEAIYGAQVIAAMEAQAFVEPDLHKLLDVGVSFIPKDSLVRRMIDDLRSFRAKNADWRAAMTDVMERHYGYDRYGGNCHIIPNHGLIVLALLYGDDDFQRSLMIANTCGWDTDCNSGNVGCLMGIKNGLAGIDAGPDWRGPVADRLYVPTADSGACVTDAVTETYRLVNAGRALAGQPPVSPKGGARFHFSLPGSVQGFAADAAPDSRGATVVENVEGRLAVRYRKLAVGRPARAVTPTFMPADVAKTGGAYAMLASPTLWPGQTVTANVQADAEDVTPVLVRLFARYYGERDEPAIVYGTEAALSPGASRELAWVVPSTGGQPICEIGIELAATRGASGTVHVDRLAWDGCPKVTLGAGEPTGDMWRRQWVNAVDQFGRHFRPDPAAHAFTLIQATGRGMAITGTRDWLDYAVSATVTPHLAAACGLAARVRGLRRYYALLLVVDDAGRRSARLVKVRDDVERVLAERPFDWAWDSGHAYAMRLAVVGDRVTGAIDGTTLFDETDADRPHAGGGVALVIDGGRTAVGPVTVGPA